MTWIDEHKQLFRMASLAALILALAGPWTYDLINVPAEYTCSPPNIRLEGDFCGMPLSGIRVYSLMFEAFIPYTVDFFTGTAVFAEHAREYFLILLFLLPLLPLLSTVLALWKKDSRPLHVFQLVAWGLAGLVVSVWCLILVANPHPAKWRLWGLWSFMMLGFSVLVGEISTMKSA